MPIGRMRTSMIVLSASLIVLMLAMLVWLGRAPQGLSASDQLREDDVLGGAGEEVFYLGLIPERDIFAQRRRYRALAEYLSDTLDRPVTLVTSNTYHGALNDLTSGKIDGAFMGSMVATLALDQLRAHVLVKPETVNGETTYRGVIFVRDDSSIQNFDDLSERSIAMVRTTTAGHLFPVYALTERGMLTGEGAAVMRWVGTHDRAIEEVYDGRVEAGAAKDLRIDAFEQAHQGYRFRRLIVSEAVPNNALIVRHELGGGLTEQLRNALLEMDQSETGRAALSVFGAHRFLPCAAGEYRPVYDMVERLGPGWGRIGEPYTNAAPEVSPDTEETDHTPSPGVP